MKTALWTIASLLLAAQGGKKGPLPGEGIDWKGDWEAAITEATARNVPIVLHVHKDN